MQLLKSCDYLQLYWQTNFICLTGDRSTGNARVCHTLNHLSCFTCESTAVDVGRCHFLVVQLYPMINSKRIAS